MNEEDDMDSSAVFAVPSSAKKKSRLKKKVKQFKSLNSSTLQQNVSLNSSIVKHTLRANNRELARALQLTKQDLGASQSREIAMQEERQLMQARIAALTKVAGLKNADIDREVEDRMQNRLTDIRVVLNKVTCNLLSTVDLLHDAMGLCTVNNGSNRPSCDSSGPRDSTADPSRLSHSPPMAKSSLFYNGPPNAPPATASDPLPPYPPMSLSCPDLSIIMEKSYFVEDAAIPFTEEEPIEEEEDEEEEEVIAQGQKQQEQKAPTRRSSQNSLRRRNSRRSSLLPHAPPAMLATDTNDLPQRRKTRSRSQSCQDAAICILQNAADIESITTAAVNKSPENVAIEHASIFKPRSEIPRSPPSNSGSERNSLALEAAEKTGLDEEDEATIVYNIPKFVSLEVNGKRNSGSFGDNKRKSVEGAGKKEVSGSKALVKNVEMADRKKDKVENKGARKSDEKVEKKETRKSDEKVGKKETKKAEEKVLKKETKKKEEKVEKKEIIKIEEKAGKKENKKLQEKVEKKIVQEEKQVVEKTVEINDAKKDVHKQEVKKRRGTFVLPSKEKEVEEDVLTMDNPVGKNRRGTFVVPAVPPPKVHVDPKEVAPENLGGRRKTFVLSESQEDIMNESASVLLQSEDEMVFDSVLDVPKSEEFAEKTICEEEDMEFTAVISQISQNEIYSSYPQPGQVCRKNENEIEAETSLTSQDSIFKDLEKVETPKAELPAFIKRARSEEPGFLTEANSPCVNATEGIVVEETIVESVESDAQDSDKVKEREGSESDVEESKRGRRRVRKAKPIETETESEKEESVEKGKAKKKRGTSVERSKLSRVRRGTFNAKREESAESESVDEENNTEVVQSRSRRSKKKVVEDKISEPPLKRARDVEKVSIKAIPAIVISQEDDVIETSEKALQENLEDKEVDADEILPDSGEVFIVEEAAENKTGTQKAGEKADDHVFKVPPVPPARRKKTKERKQRLASSTSNEENDILEQGEAEVVPQRSRSKRRAKSAVQNYAENDEEDVGQEAKAKSDEVIDVQDTDSETEGTIKKFNAFVVQPGKITFKAGRKNMTDMISGKYKFQTHSTLPRVPKSKARSKPRLVPDFRQEPVEKDPNAVKSVFDLSLNESVTIAPSQTNYTDFKERNFSQVNTVKTQLALPKKQVRNINAADQSMAESPHGIMLVLENGKRTKNRNRSKSVRYARKLVDVHLRTPHRSDVESSEDEEDAHERSIRQYAGATPPRRGKRKAEDSQVVPETPPQASPSPPSKSPEQCSDIVLSTSPEQSQVTVPSTPPKPNQDTVPPTPPEPSQDTEPSTSPGQIQDTVPASPPSLPPQQSVEAAEERKRHRTTAEKEVEECSPKKRPSMEKKETVAPKVSKLSLAKKEKPKEPLSRMQLLRQKFQHSQRATTSKPTETTDTKSQDSNAHIQFYSESDAEPIQGRNEAPVADAHKSVELESQKTKRLSVEVAKKPEEAAAKVNKPERVVIECRGIKEKEEKVKEKVEVKEKKSKKAAEKEKKKAAEKEEKRAAEKEKKKAAEIERKAAEKINADKARKGEDKEKRSEDGEKKDNKENQKEKSSKADENVEEKAEQLPKKLDKVDKNKRRSRLSILLRPDQIKRELMEVTTTVDREEQEEQVKEECTEDSRASYDGRRSRRAAASAKSYKEPSGNAKLRQGDQGTTTIYSGKDAVQPIAGKKEKKGKKAAGEPSAQSRKRQALEIIN